MAAKESPDVGRTDMESVVNRWIVDYYLSLALEAFDQEQSENFRKIKNVLDSVLVRPVEYNHIMPIKLHVFQLLSCLDDSERLDVSGESVTPLERALKLLQGMRQDCSLPGQELENMCTSVKEMLVVVLIKASKFDKAKEMLTMHFPNPVVGKKAIFMGLISQRSNTHEVIQQSDFVQFKKEMSAFCQKLCPSVPFLHKAAKQLIDSRIAEPECNAARPEEEEEPGSSSVEQIDTIPCLSSKHKIMQKTRLEAAYKALFPQAEKRTLAQLEEEVEREDQERTDDLILRLSPSVKEGCSQDSDPDEVFQRGSGSPMEASVADHPSQTDAVPDTQVGSITKSASPSQRNGKLVTVARLVVEPDSLSSSQCTVASQELDEEALEMESPQSPTIANKNAVQSPLSDSNINKPSPKPRSHRRRPAVVLTDSEEDLPASEAHQERVVVETQSQYNSSLGNSPKSQGGVESLDERIEDREDPPGDEDSRSATLRTPEQAEKSRVSPTSSPENIIDSSLDSSPGMALHRKPLPQTSSTPHASREKNPARLKWKQLYNNAKESKETWSDEETNFPPAKNRLLHDTSSSNPGHRKRKWTQHETEMLIQGVEKFGEGNWSKIITHYAFRDRTNVNLKDRWRTLKKLNQV